MEANMLIGATPQIQKEMLMNLRIRPEDILAFLVFLFVTLGAIAYLQYLIANVLEYADYINMLFVSL
jgi:hypothetical protein